MLSPSRVRGLAARLVALPSVSPDEAAETACARALAALLPPGLERGEWPTRDGRPVVWAFRPGSLPRTALLLGHYDTVGVAEYAELDAPGGERVAFDSATLGRLFAERARRGRGDLPAELVADLEEEDRRPGTWMFGRGALDMKGGLAAAIAALGEAAGSPAASVLFVATPDEEHESAGMAAAAPAIARFRDRRGLELLGVLNLDYGLEPAAYAGVAGKLEVGCFVLGRPMHVGDPRPGADAIQLAAAIAAGVGRDGTLADRCEARVGPPPVPLRFDDLKSGYSVRTAAEAMVEFNVVTYARPLEETLAALGEAVARALAGTGCRGGAGAEFPAARVLTVPELTELAGPAADRRAAADVPGGDPRTSTLERLRRLCRAARVTGPAAVVHLLPPYYPAAPPGGGPLARAARRALAGEGVPIEPYYPFISDASYVAWRSEPATAVARHLPSLDREYVLPCEAARALDLDVVNLGPWGRDAHGLHERVHAPYAFERLPRLIARVIREAAAER